MIYVDASAIVAVFLKEEHAEAIMHILEKPKETFTSPLTIYEAVMAVARVWNVGPSYAEIRVQRFLDESGIQVRSVSPSLAKEAASASERFGKGRHPAKLNMGDCFSYAMASAHNASILFVGNDFSLTDLKSALPISH